MSTCEIVPAVRPGEIAASYLKAGLSVIPIRGDGSKAAVVRWSDYQKRPATEDELRRWFIADNVGIGVVYGAVSGNAEAIDIDDGQLLTRFHMEIERLSSGLIERLTIIKTPRPGYHLIYRCSAVEGNRKLAQSIDGATLIETRGEGGYALAPGSPGECHETGRSYEHHDGPPLTELTTITPEERSILFRVAASFSELVDEPQLPQQSRQYSSLSPGDDFNCRAKWVDILTPHGWEIDHTSNEIVYWRRPEKSQGWSATTGLKSKSGTELFCCFSTSAHPFEGANGRSACTTYSKFAAHTLLNHGGDYSVAARQLAGDDYGERQVTVSTSPQKAGDELTYLWYARNLSSIHLRYSYTQELRLMRKSFVGKNVFSVQATLCCTLLTIASPNVASAIVDSHTSLIGANINVSAFFPDETTVFLDPGDVIVSDNIEYPQGTYRNYNDGLQVDIGNNQIFITDTKSEPRSFIDRPFNGFILEVLSGGLQFASASINEASTFPPISLSLDGDHRVLMNFAGITTPADGGVIIDLTFVPEPSSLALCSLGITLAGVIRQR